MKIIPLSELEMFELLQVAYPGRFEDKDDDSWDNAMDFVDQIQGFDEIADLLGRVVMMSSPMRSALTDKQRHCLGAVKVSGDSVDMIAVVKRDVA